MSRALDEQPHLHIDIMTPRLMGLPMQLRQFIAKPIAQSSPLAFLAPQFQSRSAHILSSISDNPSAYNKRIRRGRGPASGKGKTSGRGHKGQGQHGKVPAGFNGGQTKDIIVHGERGGTTEYVFHQPSYPFLSRPQPHGHQPIQPTETKLVLNSLSNTPATGFTPSTPLSTSHAYKNGSTKAASTQRAQLQSAN